MYNNRHADDYTRRKVVDPFPRYCISPQGLLKWIALMFTIIVFCLILAPHNDEVNEIWTLGEEFTILTCAFTMGISLLYLLVFFLGCHKGLCHDCECNNFGYVFYFLGMIMWYISGAVETYAAVKYLEWEHTAFCYANGLIYTALLILVKFLGP